MRSLIVIAVCAALLISIPGAAVAVTEPDTGSEAKGADFIIVPPWSEGMHNVECGYGCGIHSGIDTAGTANDHYALDFDLDPGEAVHPVADGLVLYAAHGTTGSDGGVGWTPFGNLVYLKHEDGYTSLYAHLDSIDVEPGQEVTVATPLGGAGDTGTDSVHLHFALFKGASEQEGQQPFGGRAVVPEPFAQCSGDCEDLVAGSQLTRVSDGDTTPTDTSGPDPVLSGHWIAPADGASLASPAALSAWPTSRLEDVAITRVVFHARWDVGDAVACTTTVEGVDGLWSCTSDLAALGVPAGPVDLTFDVFDDAGDVTRRADSVSVTLATDNSEAEALTAKWAAPQKGAKLATSKLKLWAKPSSTEDGAQAARVVYSVKWGNRKPKRACVARKSDDRGRWSCTLDLWKLGARLGRLTLSFDVVDTDGNVVRSPAGSRNVRFASKPPRPTNVTYKLVRSTEVSPEWGETEHVYRIRWQAPAGSATRYHIYLVRGCYARRKGDPCIREGLSFPPSDIYELGTVDGSKRSYPYKFTTGWEAHPESAVLVQAWNPIGFSRSAIAYSPICHGIFYKCR